LRLVPMTRIPSAAPRFATARPMVPSPSTPRVFPESRCVPNSFHSRSRCWAIARGSCLATARIRARTNSLISGSWAPRALASRTRSGRSGAGSTASAPIRRSRCARSQWPRGVWKASSTSTWSMPATNSCSRVQTRYSRSGNSAWAASRSASPRAPKA
jgi:hypothetical protein